MTRLRGIILICLLIISIPTILPSSSEAGSMQYLYDDAGRLTAAVSDTGDAVIYIYDEVGNLLSITRNAINPTPPVIQGISPDVLFIGSTTPVVITGQNLLTTKEVMADNTFLSIRILSVTETQVKCEITVSAQALPGTVTLSVDTLYGSANVQAGLTLSQLTLGPGLQSLAPGGSGNIAATIAPSLGRAETIQIRSSDSSIVTAPQSVTIPASGTVLFPVSALMEGVANISSGSPVATVVVTTSTFTPESGEQLTSAGRPVSVYIDSPLTGSATAASPVSAYIDSPVGNSSLSSQLLSVIVDSPGGNSFLQSQPFSVGIGSLDTNSFVQSLSLSVSIDAPVDGSSFLTTPPVSVSIDAPDGNSSIQSQQLSVIIDSPSGNSFLQSWPLSVIIDAAPANSFIQSLPMSAIMDSPYGNSSIQSQPVSVNKLSQ